MPMCKARKPIELAHQNGLPIQRTGLKTDAFQMGFAGGMVALSVELDATGRLKCETMIHHASGVVQRIALAGPNISDTLNWILEGPSYCSARSAQWRKSRGIITVAREVGPHRGQIGSLQSTAPRF